MRMYEHFNVLFVRDQLIYNIYYCLYITRAFVVGNEIREFLLLLYMGGERKFTFK